MGESGGSGETGGRRGVVWEGVQWNSLCCWLQAGLGSRPDNAANISTSHEGRVSAWPRGHKRMLDETAGDPSAYLLTARCPLLSPLP